MKREKMQATNKLDFGIKFNLKIDKNLKTSTKVEIKEKDSQKKGKVPPMFEQSDVLFLSKPLKKVEKENKRKLVSVELSKNRKERKLASKTTDVAKKIFRRKKKLKLKLKESVVTIQEVETIDRQLKAILEESSA